MGLYEKIELRVNLKATYSNPYDPDEVDLWAEFKSPSGKAWRIPGFYNPSSWASLWMVRFAPTETGSWQYVVKVRDAKGTATSAAGTFDVVLSAHHGFVTVAPNKRYLKYSDGTSFYGIGLWYNDEYVSFNRGSIQVAALDELKRRGANFICFFPTLLETMGTGLGRYDQNRCGRLDQLFKWCRSATSTWPGTSGFTRTSLKPSGEAATPSTGITPIVWWPMPRISLSATRRGNTRRNCIVTSSRAGDTAAPLALVRDRRDQRDGGLVARRTGRGGKVVSQDEPVLPRARPLRPAHDRHPERRDRRVVAGRLPNLRRRRQGSLRGARPPHAEKWQARPAGRECAYG